VPKLSVTIITRNEAGRIAGALESVAWADEVLVLDAESTDATRSIAARHTPHVLVRPWQSYAEQKNHAAALASHDWILSLDADERISPDLAQEIQALLAGTPGATGYRIPRVTWYLGRWIRCTDWYPDPQLRLYDRRAARWVEVPVHESVRLERGRPGRLKGEILHYAHRDLSHHLETINRYTTLAAGHLHARGARAGIVDLIWRPLFAFLRNYVLLAGFRAGTAGLIVSLMNSYYVLLKFAKLWERGAAPVDVPKAAPSSEAPMAE
jgi:glycosyltransferase involved in cell wall biosynthesis